MNRILIITRKESDLSKLILAHCPGAAMCDPGGEVPVEEFDALCILSGNEDRPLMLSAPLRNRVEAARAAGKPVFTEFVTSIGSTYIGIDIPATMTHHRAVYVEGGLNCPGLRTGDVLDGHYNSCCQYAFIPEDAKPVLYYHPYVCAHDHIEMSDEALRKGICAMYRDGNTLVCALRLCNFRRARLSPVGDWERIITQILGHLAGEALDVRFREPVCTFAKGSRVESYDDVKDAVARGLAWYENADMMIEGGAYGFHEGLSHHILAKNGKQLRVELVRNDCTGESAGAFMMDAILTGSEKSRSIYKAASDFCFNHLQVKDGPYKGMMRWSEIAWGTCYQDDVARVLIPGLLEANFAGGTAHFDDIMDALEFLVKTTGTNGLRQSRTDIPNLNEEKWKELVSGQGTPTAHHNGYYAAALLLAYRAGGPANFLEVAEKGLASIMALYPNTVRETSETEENCRLVLPLAVLYQVTGKEEHKAWLYRVTEELQKVRHESGTYREWDTGYQANCSRRENGECALLAENGDPVSDLLYSVNWLPLGFAYAYLATGDALFWKLWLDIAGFMVSCQIRSEDPTLDGAWARAFDLKRWEINGVPHDIGWAPCCVESGWTVGEILMGMQFMKIVENAMKG